MIRFGCAEPGAASYVDLVADSVREITLNGAPIDPATAWADGRIALAGLAQQNELTVVADCRYSHDGTGLHRAVDPADQKVYTYTKFEPAYARTVYANFEQPDLKASFSISVIVPAHWSVLSNEPLDEQTPAGDGSVVWRFRPTPRLSTYLFAIAAGEYEVVRATHTTPGGQVIPLGLACRASMAEFLAAEDILDTTRKGLDYYTALFQTDYPFTKYDQVFVPEYSVGATENAGCVIFTDQLLFRSRVTDTLYELRASVILHEMAHMWFGDLVTMRWWDDLWLNESFAEFCAALASAEATRYTDAWTTFATGRKAWGYVQDQLPSTHPIAADVPTLSEAIANFDGISYAKGASVLRQLVAMIGRDSFFAGIRAYFAAYGWGNATLADWLSTLEASSGTSLTDWSKAWLETAGPSTLRSEFERRCRRPFHLVRGAAGSARRAPDAAAAPDRHRPVQPGRRVARAHKPGPGRHRRRPDGDSRAGRRRAAGPHRAERRRSELRDHPVRRPLDRDPDLVDRPAQRLAGAGHLLDLGYRHGPPRPSCRCPRSSPWWRAAWPANRRSPRCRACWRSAGSCCARWPIRPGRPRPTGSWPTLVGGCCWPPSRAATTSLPGRSCSAGARRQVEQLDLIGGLLDGTAGPAGLTVGTELRWALLQRLAVNGRAGDAEIDAQLERDNTDAGYRSAAACRAAIGDAEHKAAAWALLAESADISADLLRSVASAFHQPSQSALLAPYARRYFDLLPDIWSASGGHLRVARGAALFPVTAASQELIDEIDGFLAATAREPGLVRVLIERRDQVQRALRSRALSAAAD